MSPTVDVHAPTEPGPLLEVTAVQWWGRTPYLLGLERQRALHAAVAEGAAPDTLVLLEHDEVYTAGRRTEPAERPTASHPTVVDVDRGGKITWHGPGQLVGYPVVRLPDPLDVIGHVRRVEALMMATCASLGLLVRRVEERSGVWTTGAPAAKVGAVGIRVSRGVTSHGFALNADCDLRAFDAIVPCGIRDAGVTSLTAELGRTVDVPAVRAAIMDVLRISAGPTS